MFKGYNLVLFFDKDYTKGNFSIKGDAATYLYVWESTEDNTLYTMTLQKQ